MEQQFTPLTQNPIPALNQSQLDMFTDQPSIHAQPLGQFDVSKSLQTLHDKEGSYVIGADFGGDKGQSQLFRIQGGQLVADDAYTDYVQGDLGAGYLASMEKTARYAQENNIPVGISWGAPIDGTKPLFHPKATVFLDELQQKYDGDLANLFTSNSVCYNDGPAGLIGAIVVANQQAPTSSVLFPINGGGIGMAVLTNGTLYATESGHVQAIDDLNIYNQSVACGVFEASFVCLERLGANKAGIEAQWQARTGDYLRARDIEDRYKAGDAFAGELYDNSALILAHVIQGTAKAMGINLADTATAVVGHGGAFKFPHYGERVQQILETHNSSPVRLLMMKDHVAPGSNACLDGAALAALIA
jgi:predicted NBD/HSP70 family sugar kinase